MMVAMLKIPLVPIHTAWLHESFEYPAMHKDVEQAMEYVEMSTLVEDGQAMAKLQEEFLGLAVGDVDTAIKAPRWKKKRQMDVGEEDDDL